MSERRSLLWLFNTHRTDLPPSVCPTCQSAGFQAVVLTVLAIASDAAVDIQAQACMWTWYHSAEYAAEKWELCDLDTVCLTSQEPPECFSKWLFNFTFLLAVQLISVA